MYAARDVATYVISEYWKQGNPITNLKLQKILYYIQGYTYKFCNTASFDGEIYRWPYGPVVPDVYFRYNHHHAMPLEQPSEYESVFACSQLKNDLALFSTVEKVIQASVRYSASDLVNKTHQETPWCKAADNSIISNQSIAEYFYKHDPLEIAGNDT